jgi:hypothetical protein
VLWLTAGYFQGDCGTYFQQGTNWWAGQVPYRDYVVEYPPAAVSVFALLAAVGSYPAFRITFVALMLALDACVFLLLQRRGRSSALGVWAYLVASALLFPVLYVRFDLLPAAATLGACLLLAPAFDRAGDPPATRRLLAGGALLGLGIAWKLYPLLIGPYLFLQLRRSTGGSRAAEVGKGPEFSDHLTSAALLPPVKNPYPRRLLVVFAAAAVVVAVSFVPALLAGAGGAVFSFLKYQGERGLQIESSYASVLMVVNGVFPLGIEHQMTHHAHDVAGALPAAIAPWTRPLQVAAVVGVSVLAHRRRVPLTQAFAAVVAIALATANVFSPQFLIWLLPLAAAALGGSRDAPSAALLVAVAALTSLVFPTLYPKLLQLRIEAALPLLVRNVLLLALAVRLSAQPRT